MYKFPIIAPIAQSPRPSPTPSSILPVSQRSILAPQRPRAHWAPHTTFLLHSLSWRKQKSSRAAFSLSLSLSLSLSPSPTQRGAAAEMQRNLIPLTHPHTYHTRTPIPSHGKNVISYYYMIRFELIAGPDRKGVFLFFFCLLKCRERVSMPTFVIGFGRDVVRAVVPFGICEGDEGKERKYWL
ncbi:hypothetical protein F5Y15DRAFT_61883 [Xylariaceae sp. FL0016]|nr:hypothetical protein F5Y15DRAFT_61883 [Xylariaceae sp. FL0016]